MKSQEWREAALKDVCESVIDCVNKTAPVVSYPTPYKMIRTTNVKNGVISLDSVRYVEKETFDKWTRRSVPQPGDVILTREAPLGEVGMMPTNSENVFLGQRLMQYRANPEKLNPYFLLYSFQEEFMQGQIKAAGSGSTVEHMRVGDAEDLKIRLPEIDIQNDIAGILSAYDSLIENNNRRIAILENMAQSLYREWFVNFRFPGHENCKFVDSPLGRVPEGWAYKKLKDVCRLTMGQSPKSEFYNEVGDGMPFHQGVTNFGTRFPADKLYCTADGRIAEEGDILFSIRAPVGRMNIANKKIVIGRGVSAIRHLDGRQAFLWEQLKSQFTKLDMMGNGAIFAAVTKDDMQGIDLLCPDSNILSIASEFLNPLHSEIFNLSRAVINLKEQRDMLLPRLVSGRILVQGEF